jgi:Protein of unknown function (DUF2585)
MNMQKIKKFFGELPANFWIIAVFIVSAQAILLYLFGQPLISKTGQVMLWTGTVNGPENSQQISDWYTFSHIIHGFLFYWLLAFIFFKLFKINIKENAKYIWIAALCAMCIEAAWELLENSPMIINRYREGTLAVGYSGDSVLNSIFDNVWMFLGFAFSYLNNWKVVLIIAIIFELMTLYFIKDNLVLNIIMLTYPLDAIRDWQVRA